VARGHPSSRRRVIRRHCLHQVVSRGVKILARQRQQGEGLESVTTGEDLFRGRTSFLGLVCRCHPGTHCLSFERMFSCKVFEFRVLSAARISWLTSPRNAGSAPGNGLPVMLLVHRPITVTNNMKKCKPALVGEPNPEDLAPETVGTSPSSRSPLPCVGSNALKVLRLHRILQTRCSPPWRRGWRTAAHRPEIPATPFMWNGVQGPLWSACRNSRNSGKIAATPKLGAKKPAA